MKSQGNSLSKIVDRHSSFSDWSGRTKVRRFVGPERRARLTTDGNNAFSLRAHSVALFISFIGIN